MVVRQLILLSLKLSFPDWFLELLQLSSLVMAVVVLKTYNGILCEWCVHVCARCTYYVCAQSVQGTNACCIYITVT